MAEIGKRRPEGGRPGTEKPADEDHELSEDERVEEGSEESFPASDPPSYTPTVPGRPAGAG